MTSNDEARRKDAAGDLDFEDLEQSAFEKWLRDRCPSGDVESVQRQWLESYEYAELLDVYKANEAEYNAAQEARRTKCI